MAAENPPLATLATLDAHAPHAAPRPHAPPPGMWDLDELERQPPPPLSTRALRAAGVAAVWALALLPVATGWQRCAVATLLHRPCPGCGMTRAILLLAGGHVEDSLRMHALAVPVLLMGVFFILSTVWTTFAIGTPITLYKGRLGRVTLSVMAIVYGAAMALWVARCFGLFGGPVSVY
jgi:hypothetical protein